MNFNFDFENQISDLIPIIGDSQTLVKSGHIEALSGHMEPILSFEITNNNTRFSLTKVLLSNIFEIANSYIHVNEAF